MNHDPVIPKRRSWLQYILLAILLLVFWLLQSLPGEAFCIGGIRPLALPMLVVAVAIEYGYAAGGVMGLAAGILMDLYTVPAVGFNTVMLVATGIGCGLLVRYFFMRNLPSTAVVCLAASFQYYLFYFLVCKVLPGMTDAFSYFLRFSLPGTVLTALLGWIICLAVYGIRKIP